jgi:hypothetical protein
MVAGLHYFYREEDILHYMANGGRWPRHMVWRGHPQ